LPQPQQQKRILKTLMEDGFSLEKQKQRVCCNSTIMPHSPNGARIGSGLLFCNMFATTFNNAKIKKIKFGL